MKLTFYPSTKTGIYAITFMIMAVILVVVLAYLFFVISLVTGLLAVIRDKERSILSMGAVLLSFVAVYFGTMEFIGEMNLFNLQTK